VDALDGVAPCCVLGLEVVERHLDLVLGDGKALRGGTRHEGQRTHSGTLHEALKDAESTAHPVPDEFVGCPRDAEQAGDLSLVVVGHGALGRAGLLGVGLRVWVLDGRTRASR